MWDCPWDFLNGNRRKRVHNRGLQQSQTGGFSRACNIKNFATHSEEDSGLSPVAPTKCANVKLILDVSGVVKLRSRA